MIADVKLHIPYRFSWRGNIVTSCLLLTSKALLLLTPNVNTVRLVDDYCIKLRPEAVGL